MHTSLRALIEPESIEFLSNITYMAMTTLAFSYLAFVVFIS